MRYIHEHGTLRSSEVVHVNEIRRKANRFQMVEMSYWRSNFKQDRRGRASPFAHCYYIKRVLHYRILVVYVGLLR